MTELREQRSADRYVALRPLTGSFGAASVEITDLSPEGMQVSHAQPLRLGMHARLWLRGGGVTVALQAQVIWSHLSKEPNAEGKYLYRSGLRIDGTSPELTAAIGALVEAGAIRRDLDSLDRKRRQIAERERERSSKPVVKMIRTEAISPDQLLLIQQARERLRANPEEAKKWYQRARFAVSTDSMRHAEDVLAVWEFLERSVDLATIERVFAGK